MHVSVFNFVFSLAEKYKQHFLFKNVLEVGSLNVNGSVKPLFVGCDYTGIDLMPGPNVDQVGHLMTQGFGETSFDTVISLEAMEHDSLWKESLREMYRVLKPGGLLILTFATDGRAEHGTHKADPEASPATLDHYHNISFSEFSDTICMDGFSCFDLHVDTTLGDFHFAGIKQ